MVIYHGTIRKKSPLNRSKQFTDSIYILNDEEQTQFEKVLPNNPKNGNEKSLKHPTMIFQRFEMLNFTGVGTSCRSSLAVMPPQVIEEQHYPPK